MANKIALISGFIIIEDIVIPSTYFEFTPSLVISKSLSLDIDDIQFVINPQIDIISTKILSLSISFDFNTSLIETKELSFGSQILNFNPEFSVQVLSSQVVLPSFEFEFTPSLIVSKSLSFEEIQFIINPELQVLFDRLQDLSISFDFNTSLIETKELSFGSQIINFNPEFMSNVFIESINEKHVDFTIGNRFKKEFLGSFKTGGLIQNEHICASLLNSDFIFDPDIHQYFINQVDEYEITKQNGYLGEEDFEFNNLSEDGILSFKELSFPLASGGSYGTVGSVIVYDYTLHAQGLIIGCFQFIDYKTIFVENTCLIISGFSLQIT